MFGDVFGRFRGWFRVYVEEMFGEGFETCLGGFRAEFERCLDSRREGLGRLTNLYEPTTKQY